MIEEFDWMDEFEKLILAADYEHEHTWGYPSRIAKEIEDWLAWIRSTDEPSPNVKIRYLIEGVLSAVEVDWDRKEDAPEWEDDE